MRDRVLQVATALVAACLLVGCEPGDFQEPAGPTAADQRACRMVRGAPDPPNPPAIGGIWSDDSVWGTPEERNQRYQNQLQEHEAGVREIMAQVSNADDERLRSQSTVEGAAVRCRDLGA